MARPGGRPFRPKGPNEDGLTYLPVDRSGIGKKVYGPTDPRNAKTRGGMRLGKSGRFLLDEQVPSLDAELIGGACDTIARGQQVYSSLLYLGRAKVADIPALLAASQSYEVRVRWERLWVLTPFLSRLSRQEEGRQALLQGLADDLPGVHLLSKFAEQNNPSLQRMFKRLHDPLLQHLLQQLSQGLDDPRRAALIAGIVAVLEQKEPALRRLMPPGLAPERIDEMLAMLYTKPNIDYGSRLSSTLLRDKLEGWRRG